MHPRLQHSSEYKKIFKKETKMTGLTAAVFLFLLVVLVLHLVERKGRQSRLKIRFSHVLDRQKEFLNESWQSFCTQLESLQKKLRLDKDKKMVVCARETGQEVFNSELAYLANFLSVNKPSEKLLSQITKRPTNIFDSQLLDILRRVVSYQSAVIEAPGTILTLEKEVDEHLRQLRELAKTHIAVLESVTRLDNSSMQLFRARQLIYDSGDYEEALNMADKVRKDFASIMDAAKTWTEIMPSDDEEEKNPLSKEARRDKMLEILNK